MQNCMEMKGMKDMDMKGMDMKDMDAKKCKDMMKDMPAKAPRQPSPRPMKLTRW